MSSSIRYTFFAEYVDNRRIHEPEDRKKQGKRQKEKVPDFPKCNTQYALRNTL